MVIVILGPTAVGKTKLSVELAKKLNGEIINADSTQVYKNLNIGTAKVTEEEKQGIVHHLFDIKELTEAFLKQYTYMDIEDVVERIISKYDLSEADKKIMKEQIFVLIKIIAKSG